MKSIEVTANNSSTVVNQSNPEIKPNKFATGEACSNIFQIGKFVD